MKIDSFTEWLKREMPSGTVISNPEWWATRIHKAFLAASQLREKELRRLLAEISTLGAATYYDAKDIADEALAFPTDDTALQARLKDEREKCAVKCEQHGQTLGSILAAEIRSMT